jgi:DNA replication and repair protein RecF
MRLLSLKTENVRNLQSIELFPSEGLNMITGKNAQGKTNLLEIIWIFTGGRSFKGSKDSELTAYGQRFAAAAIEFYGGERKQSAKIQLKDGKREVILNRKQQKSAACLVGKFCATVFFPPQLSLVQEGPAARRAFLNAAACQSVTGYAGNILKLRRVTEQRNALLKAAHEQHRQTLSKEISTLLDAWDEEYAALVCAVTRDRIDYVAKLSKRAAEIYLGISGGREELLINYEPSAEKQHLKEEFIKELEAHRRKDILYKATTLGPHRDNLEVTISGKSARIYASQGQQRSAVLAMKLSEAEVLQEAIGEPPVVLLDDVMSELDGGRRGYLKTKLNGRQIFITSCEPTALSKEIEGKIFLMENGVLKDV